MADVATRTRKPTQPDLIQRKLFAMGFHAYCSPEYIKRFVDRGSLYPSLGFKAADVTRANAILIGHGHHDHMSDAASIGARTGATVIGAPVTTEKLATQQIDPKLVKTVTGRGGELLKFDGFAIEPILGRHGQPSRQVVEPIEHALNSITRPTTVCSATRWASIVSAPNWLSDPAKTSSPVPFSTGTLSPVKAL